MKKLKKYVVSNLLEINKELNIDLKESDRCCRIGLDMIKERDDKITTLESQNKALQLEKEKLESANTWLKNENARIEKEMRFSDAIADKQAKLIEKLHGELDEVRKAKEDCLTNIQSLNVEIGSMWRKNQELQSALNSFEDLKKEVGNVHEGVTVWIAKDSESDVFIFTDKPIFNKQCINGLAYNSLLSKIKEARKRDLEWINEIKPLQCKQFRLLEAQS